MSWRTVIISNRCKLDYNTGFLVVRGEETRRVFIDEIAILIIENTAVSLTACLLEALIQKKVRIVFCDSKRSPMAELCPYNGSYDCSRKIKLQSKWSKDIKCLIWNEIVSEKIRKQAEFLREINRQKEADLISSYLLQLEEYDASNREGHAAKVYFNAVFGMDFTRTADVATNAALDYGYSIILSAINREISINGYLPNIGLFHDNMFNFYNLGCDLMEPFRILVDRKVYSERPFEFLQKDKYALYDILNQTVIIDKTHQTVLNAMKIYVRSVFDAINEKDVSKIKFFYMP